jgi:FkbM family methyltransferase
VPYCFENLKRNFSDNSRFTLDRVAVGASRGTSKFYYVDHRVIDEFPDLPHWYDQIGSFDRSYVEAQLKGILKPYIIEMDVEVMPLADLFAKHEIGHIHVLQIDTEGHDLNVLRTADFGRFPVTSVLVEHKHLSDSDRDEMRHILTLNGFAIHDCGEDYFAVRN